MKRLFLGSLVVAGATLLHAVTVAGPIKRISQPSISPDGKEIVFSWQNDIWIGSSMGGNVRRLTVHPATDMMPRFMPNGKEISFSSNRYGTSDLFIMNKDGGNIRRVTNDPGNESLFSISPDGSQLLGQGTSWGRANAFRVNATGGEILPFVAHPFEMQYYATVSQDGKTVAYTMGGSAGNWRNPLEAGTDTGEIWVANNTIPATNHRKITSNEFNDYAPMITPDDKIIFISNRNKTPQLWQMNMDGKGATQLTQHNGGTVRWPNMNNTGTHVVYEYDSEAWLYDIKAKKTTKLDFDAPDDKITNPTLEVSVSALVSEFVPSPDGKRAVAVARGDLYLVAEKGGLGRRLTKGLSVDKNAVWLTKDTILFVSGRSTMRELWTVNLNGEEKQFAKTPKDLMNPILSPDGKMVAAHHGDTEIVTFPVTGGSPTVVVTAAFPGIYDDVPAFSWSPDSKWLAYASTGERTTGIMVAELATKQSKLITKIARGASTPIWHPQGKILAYTASDTDTGRVAFVDLVQPDLTFSEDDLDKIDEPKPAPAGPVEVKIDFRNIQQRERTVMTDGGIAGFTGDGRSAVVTGAGGLSLMPVRGGSATPIAGIVGAPTNIYFNPDGKVYIVAGGRPMLVAGQPQASPIPFTANTTVDRQAEEIELFKEIWWGMNRMYYDPGMHGKNWNMIQSEYGALVPYCFDRQDFYALMTEMIEELDSSHLSINPAPGGAQLERESIGWLGVDWNNAQLASGKYVVGVTYVGGPADHSSVNLQPGDEIVSVDGASLSGTTLTKALTGKAERKVRLGVKRNGKPEVETVTIKPTSPLAATGMRYERFIADRRAEAEKLTGGKVAYYHIQGMNGPSTDRFMQENRTVGEGKKGAVVDVRWNGGGNTANRMLAALRLDTSWLNRRFRAMPSVAISEEMFRGNAVEMPSVLMTNQYSASNAEIFSEGFRRMKIGKVIGEATGGNVLTVGGTFGLWDGGSVQIPFIGITTIDGESLEGIGRRVDVDVRFDPNAWLQGRDNQLEEAIKAVMKQVK